MASGAATSCSISSYKENIFLPSANKVWGKVIFSVACVKNFVRGGSTWAGTPWQVIHPPGQVHPPQEQCMLGDNGQQAGGTHPTGMHSCSLKNLQRSISSNEIYTVHHSQLHNKYKIPQYKLTVTG